MRLVKGSSKGEASSPCGFPAHDVVSLDDGGHAHAGIAVLHPGLDAQNFPQSVHQHFRAAGYIRGQSQDQVKPRPSLGILIHHEVEAAGGNITRLAFFRINRFLSGDTHENRQRQIVASTGTTLWTSPHFDLHAACRLLAAFPSLD